MADERLRMIGEFVLGERLGAGGHGDVFAAVGPRGPAALKVSRGGLSLMREVAAVAALDHPNICPVLGFGRLDLQEAGATEGLNPGDPWFAMERADGSWADAPPAGEEWVSALRQVLAGLAYAHARGVLHRDVKPSNLLWRPDLAGRRPLLADFGISTRQASADPLRRAGTRAFAAPEQVNPERGILGPWSDLYALGRTVIALLGGRADRSPVELGLSPALERWLLWLTDPDPLGRPRSAAAAAAGLPTGDPGGRQLALEAAPTTRGLGGTTMSVAEVGQPSLRLEEAPRPRLVRGGPGSLLSIRRSPWLERGFSAAILTQAAEAEWDTRWIQVVGPAGVGCSRLAWEVAARRAEVGRADRWEIRCREDDFREHAELLRVEVGAATPAARAAALGRALEQAFPGSLILVVHDPEASAEGQALARWLETVDRPWWMVLATGAARGRPWATVEVPPWSQADLEQLARLFAGLDPEATLGRWISEAASPAALLGRLAAVPAEAWLPGPGGQVLAPDWRQASLVQEPRGDLWLQALVALGPGAGHADLQRVMGRDLAEEELYRALQRGLVRVYGPGLALNEAAFAEGELPAPDGPLLVRAALHLWDLGAGASRVRALDRWLEAGEVQEAARRAPRLVDELRVSGEAELAEAALARWERALSLDVGLSGTERKEAQAHLAVSRGWAALWGARPGEALVRLDRALADLPAASPTRLRLQELRVSALLDLGRRQEAREALQRLLEVGGLSGARREDRARIFFHRGRLALLEGDAGEAAAWLTQAWEQSEDDQLRGDCALNLANAHLLAGAPAVARAWLARARACYQAQGVAFGLAQVANNLGEIARAEGDLVGAREAYQEAFLRYREAGQAGAVLAKLNLALLDLETERWEEADAVFRQFTLRPDLVHPLIHAALPLFRIPPALARQDWAGAQGLLAGAQPVLAGPSWLDPDLRTVLVLASRLARRAGQDALAGALEAAASSRGVP